jgi:hypothetical protein
VGIGHSGSWELQARQRRERHRDKDDRQELESEWVEKVPTLAALAQSDGRADVAKAGMICGSDGKRVR